MTTRDEKAEAEAVARPYETVELDEALAALARIRERDRELLRRLAR